MSEYRVPTIDEFKQGFTFEVLRAKKGERSGFLTTFDTSNDDWTHTQVDLFHKEDQWHKVTVFWDREPEMKSKTYKGITYTWKEFPQWDWDPWVREDYIEGLLKEGKIRVYNNK